MTSPARTVPVWVPVVVLLAVLIVAAGLGLLIGHLAHGGL
jgi:hypothetical protein